MVRMRESSSGKQWEKKGEGTRGERKRKRRNERRKKEKEKEEMHIGK